MMRMVMKMAAVSTISLLLLCCYTISSTDTQSVCNHYAATEDNFTVPLTHAWDKSQTLKWKHNDDIIFDQRPENKFIKGNKENVYGNGSLKLTNLKRSNEGKYTPEIFNNDGKAIGSLKTTHLCILDRVPKPTVKTDCASTNVKFTCKVQSQVKDLNIKWLQNNKVLDKEKGPTLTRVAEQVETDVFVCEVSNRVSSMSSAPAKQTCFQRRPIFPETVLGINTWIFVGAGGGLVLVLIIIVIVCCIRAKRRKRMQMKEEGELRLAWTNEQQHRHDQHNHPPDHHHHHHHHQQQPAGHTGPRQHRSKQHRDQQRPRAPNPPGSHPQPSPRRPAQAPRPVDKTDDEQPPPLPQPRKKAVRTPKV